MKRQWYHIAARTAEPDQVDVPTTAEIRIFGDIGKSYWDDDAVSAAQFAADLQELPPTVRTLTVRVNSLGGDPFEAIAIATALDLQRTAHGRQIITQVDGVAASAATIVTAVGSPIRIAAAALMMVHDPYAFDGGNAREHRKLADTLDRVRDSIVVSYQRSSTLSAEALAELMAAETWMNAEEAIGKGFATELLTGESAAPAPAELPVAAAFTSRRIAARVPERYRPRIAALVRPTPPTPPTPTPTPTPVPAVQAASPLEVLSRCRAAGVLDVAEALIAAQAPVDQVEARIDHARTIRALCARARLAGLADGYVAACVPVAIVKAQLLHLAAVLDHVEIDSSLGVEGAGPARGHVNVQATYRDLNRNRPSSSPEI